MAGADSRDRQDSQGFSWTVVMAWLLDEGHRYGVTPLDPVAIVGAVAILTLVAIIAGFLPARRAARVDPVMARRTE